MSKRKRTSGGSVTGGTGDIKPQILTVQTIAAAAGDDYSVSQVNLPVPRFGTMKTKATVFEILSLRYYPIVADIADVTNTKAAYFATQALRTQNETCTLLTLASDITDPAVFGFVLTSKSISTNGGTVDFYPLEIDMTDQNGNGFVVAADRIFFHVGDVNGTTAGGSTCKITYRLVNIGITEYVGIVQSQQG